MLYDRNLQKNLETEISSEESSSEKPTIEIHFNFLTHNKFGLENLLLNDAVCEINRVQKSLYNIAESNGKEKIRERFNFI